jgi:N-acetylmuramoyl-L-alanine amidase
MRLTTNIFMPTRLIRVCAALWTLVLLTAGAVGSKAGVAQEAAPQPACRPAEFRLAIDIGHYRAAPGAISATGIAEFEYNLALARGVLTALRKAGFTTAFLIGETGTLLQLRERTRVAQAERAMLFVSLHHDSVQARYLSEWRVDSKPEHYSDNFHGYSVFVSDRNPYPATSLQFAELFGAALLAEGLTPSLHHAEPIPGEGKLLIDKRLGLYRFDNLVVLSSASMPAVLLESAIIVNRAEEKRVRQGDYNAKVIAAMVKAVEAYCGLHPAK